MSTTSASTGIPGTVSTPGTSQIGSTSVAVTTGESGTSGSTVSTSSIGSTTAFSGSTLTTSALTTTTTTTKRCEEMQAVNEAVSKQIIVTPTDVPQEQKPAFQPTSNQGVSFPENERTPTIIVHFGKPAEVQSVTIPLDKTPNANVEQFQVTFYSPEGKQINDKPILSSSSPNYDNTKPAHLDSSQIPSNTPVSRLEITVIQTTDNQSPKGVILDIKACTEITTG
jgi:hypothetical protein